jgi:hypothetical protein
MMKKTVVSLILSSVLTGSLYAETNSQEDILNNVLTELLKQENAVKPKVEIKKASPTIIVAKANKEQPIAVQLPVIQEKEDNIITSEKSVERVLVSNEKLLDSDNQSTRLFNEDLTIEDIHTAEKEVNIQQNEGHMFLLNVPVKTEIRANIDLILPPYRSKLSYHNGKLVSESPFKYSESVTYCYLELEESGMWRRFKSEEDKILLIEGNVSNKLKYESNENIGETVTVYETTFTTDNKHIKKLVCETSEKELPLTIKDLNDATGNLFRFKYTPMLDI